MPVQFERLNGPGVPRFGVIVAFIVGCICFLPFPSWQSLVGLITSASVLMYAGAPLSFGVPRKRLPDAERTYRLPAGAFFPPLAILLGYLILGLSRLFKLNPQTPVVNWAVAQWAPVYLIGMGVIVYISDDGPMKKPPTPLWWDIAAVE